MGRRTSDGGGYLEEELRLLHLWPFGDVKGVDGYRYGWELRGERKQLDSRGIRSQPNVLLDPICIDDQGHSIIRSGRVRVSEMVERLIECRFISAGIDDSIGEEEIRLCLAYRTVFT